VLCLTPSDKVSLFISTAAPLKYEKHVRLTTDGFNHFVYKQNLSSIVPSRLVKPKGTSRLVKGQVD